MDLSKNKHRRHSFSGTRVMANTMSREEVRQEPITDLSTHSRVLFPERKMTSDELSLGLPHSHPHPEQYQMLNVPSSRSVDHRMRRGGKSWKDILRLKRRRAKLAAPPTSVENDADVYKPKPSGYCIRVVVTEINPQAYYKTLEINHHTTAFEVIVKLIRKYALKDEDRDPNDFYLTEVKEGHQGSYSRVLGNSDQLYELQSRWDKEQDCYFALYRAHLPTRTEEDPEIEDRFEQPDVHLRAMIISPSQDSFFNSYPDLSDLLLPPPYPTHPSVHFTTPPTNTATNQNPSTYHGISSRVRTSKLIVSPSETSEDLETDMFEVPTISRLALEPIMHSTKYASFSDSKIETIAEHEAEMESPNYLHTGTEERTFPESRERVDTKQAQRQQMQKSINMGMQDIMAKVVLETKQNSPLRRKIHSRSFTAPSNLFTAPSSLFTTRSTLPQPTQGLNIRNLLCSPLAPTQEHRKTYPDFVFTPGPDYGTSDSEDDLLGSEPHGISATLEGADSLDQFGEDAAADTLDQGEDDAAADSLDRDREDVAADIFDFDRFSDIDEEDHRKVTMEDWEREKKKECKEEEDEEGGEEDDEEGEEEDDEEGEEEDEEGVDIVWISQPHKNMRKCISPPDPIAFTTIHRQLNPYSSVRASAEAKRILEICLVVHIKYTAISTFTPTVFSKLSIRTGILPLTLWGEKLDHRARKTRNMHSNRTSSSHCLSGTSESGVRAKLPLRRSHTDHAISTSVMRVKRPHSSHISTRAANNAIDFTKDEIFRTAALRGMMRKPRAKEQYPSVNTTTANIPSDKMVRFPVKDIVTDLDLAALSEEKKKHCRPFRRHSFRDISSTSYTIEQPYGRFKERKSNLDGESASRTTVSSVPDGGTVQHSHDSKLDDGSNSDETRRGSPRPSSAPTRHKSKQHMNRELIYTKPDDLWWTKLGL